MFDVDFGKFISRSLGIGEESTDEAVRVGASIITGDVAGAIIGSSQLLASEKERSQRQAQLVAQREQQFSEGNGQMPHVDGHSDGELMVPGIGLENGNLAANIIGFGSQALQNLGQNALRNLGRGGFGGGVVGGLAGTALMDGMNDNCNSCAPKPFVRFDKCDRPIITRKMKKTAIEAVNCNGSVAAAAALTGGNMDLLTTIISKQFPPMRRGISGAQLNNAARTARKLNRMHMQFQKMCKTPTRRR